MENPMDPAFGAGNRCSVDIGSRIRSKRQEMGLSLRDLAERTELTPSFLSQIERNRVSPSLNSLHRIARALGVPLFYLLTDEEQTERVVRRDERIRILPPRSNLVYELLTPQSGLPMEVFIVQPEGREENIATSFNNPTEECIYVLEGTLEVELEDQMYLLGPGDSIYFEGPRLRRLTPRGDHTVRFISAITPPIF